MLHFETTDMTSDLTHFQQIQRIKVILTLEPELREKHSKLRLWQTKKRRSSSQTPASGTPVHSTKLNKASKGKSGEEKPEIQALLQSVIVSQEEVSDVVLLPLVRILLRFYTRQRFVFAS